MPISSLWFALEFAVYKTDLNLYQVYAGGWWGEGGRGAGCL